jgi:hypothetical protein
MKECIIKDVLALGKFQEPFERLPTKPKCDNGQDPGSRQGVDEKIYDDCYSQKYWDNDKK